MPSNFSSLTIDWYDESDNYVTTSDITNDVKSIPLFTDSGTGEVNQASLTIRSLDGNYNTTGTVKFDEFDRIRIRCTDLGGNSYDRYFEIFNILPSQTKGEGTLLTLECLGIEYHVQHIHMVKPYYFDDSFTVGFSIGQIYNQNRGTRQPTLSGHEVIFKESFGFGNGLPAFNANNWEFGLNEDTCYNRWMDLIDGAGASVSAGGALTFFEMNFLTTAKDAIQFKLRKSGDNTTINQIQNAVATGVKVGEQEGMISNPTGTNLLAWGSSEHGTLPVDNSKYDSKLLQFIFRPEWRANIVYEVDAKIKVTPTTNVAPKHYKVPSGQAHTSGSVFATDLAAGKWTQIDMGDEFGDTIQYSPWTDEKATVWSNNGCDPDRTTFTTGGWCDINLVINEENYFRTWADVRATSTATLDALIDKANDGTNIGYAYDGGTSANLPRGFRILVDSSSPSGVLADFADSVVEVQPTNSVGGKTFRRLYTFDKINTKLQVAVIDEGKVYEDTITGTAGSPTHSWSPISSGSSLATSYGNDCFHQYTTLPTNVDGIDLVNDIPTEINKTRSKITDPVNRPDIIKSGSTQFSQNIDSAVEFKAVSSNIAKTAFEGASDPLSAYYTNAIGFTLRFPFPNNNYNGIGEGVGDLYGGGINSNEEPATLDAQNMNYTSGGKEGFNNTEVEDYGQINAVAMWLKYSQTVLGSEANDEHRFRAWFIDTKDNVVYQDFVIRFSNNWEDIRLPISGFRIYKGRKPIYGFTAAIASVIPPKELEVINIFEWRNIKMFGVQLQSQYDKFGRFNPAQSIVDSSGSSGTWTNLTGATRTLQMDGFRFIKPLLASSGINATRNLEPTFQQFPNITVYDQLLNVSKSHLEIEKFKHKEFNIESVGDEIFDIPFGDSFFLKNEDIISDDDKSGEDNNIKLVAKRIEYSITKPPGGKGGLRRKIKGSKVFT
jgi:hypothetical protein